MGRALDDAVGVGPPDGLTVAVGVDGGGPLVGDGDPVQKPGRQVGTTVVGAVVGTVVGADVVGAVVGALVEDWLVAWVGGRVWWDVGGGGGGAVVGS
jgi:hypothetical protein